MYPTLDKILRIRKNGNKIYSLDIISSDASNNIYIQLRQDYKSILEATGDNIAHAMKNFEKKLKFVLEERPATWRMYFEGNNVSNY
jgi:hypothetical protein